MADQEKVGGSYDSTKTTGEQDPQKKKSTWPYSSLAVSLISLAVLLLSIGYQNCVKGEIQASINELEDKVETDLKEVKKDITEEITEDLAVLRTDIGKLDDRLRAVEINVGKLQTEINRHSHESIPIPRVQFTVNSASQR